MDIKKMSSSHYETTSMDVNFAVFRDFQHLPRTVLEILYRRTALGEYIAEGMVRDALSPGFDYVDRENNVMYEDITEEQKRSMLEILIKAVAAKRAYSHSVLIYSTMKVDGVGEPFLYWLEDTSITTMEVVPGTKILSALSFIPPVEMAQQEVTVAGKELENTRLLADHTSKVGKYRSFYESIADRLIGIAVLDQQLTLLVIRLGSGIRYILAPASMLSNTAERAKLEAVLNNMGMNLLMAVPEGGKIGENFEFGIKFGEGTPPISFAEAYDTMLTPIAIKIKVPKEALKGNETGLRSGETNRQKKLNSDTELQKDLEADILWCSAKVFDRYFDGISLRWKPLVEMDEKEKLDIQKAQFDIVLRVLPSIDALGLKLQDVFTFIGLELKIDEALVESTKAEQKALNEKVIEGSSDGNKSGLPNQKTTIPKA